MEDADRIERDCTPQDDTDEDPAIGAVLTGLVWSRSSRHCHVFFRDRSLRCAVRAKLYDEGSSPLVGDHVTFRLTGRNEGTVETVLPRRNVLSRQAGHGRRSRQHRYCANVDVVVVVCATHEPPFRPALVDRLLIAARLEELTPVICLNKTDLEPEGEAVRAMEIYRCVGYEVFLTSALTGTGVDALARRLRDQTSVFSGHSGVGKTSLLQHIIPGFSRRTREVSKRARGRHATTEVFLVQLPDGGYVIDTPGFREFTVWGVEPEDIGSYYPEFLPYASNCKYHNCLHHRDPGCAVRKAVEDGLLPSLRYQSYLRILESHGEA